MKNKLLLIIFVCLLIIPTSIIVLHLYTYLSYQSQISYWVLSSSDKDNIIIEVSKTSHDNFTNITKTLKVFMIANNKENIVIPFVKNYSYEKQNIQINILMSISHSTIIFNISSKKQIEMIHVLEKNNKDELIISQLIQSWYFIVESSDSNNFYISDTQPIYIWDSYYYNDKVIVSIINKRETYSLQNITVKSIPYPIITSNFTIIYFINEGDWKRCEYEEGKPLVSCLLNLTIDRNSYLFIFNDISLISIIKI